MGLSATHSFTNDPLLMAFDTLPANKLLHEAQVALLLECKTRWLEERRSRGEPPPYVVLGDRLVRYAAGPLRDWLHRTMEEAPSSPTEHRSKKESESLGLDELILKGGRRKKMPRSSFAAFLATGAAEDEWPFVFTDDNHRPVDALDALLHVDADRVRDAGWLTLNDYIKACNLVLQSSGDKKVADQTE